MVETIFSIFIPFIGTILGSACVFVFKKNMSSNVQRAFAGFAAGVMVAATIWSLILPAFENTENMGKLSFLPILIGLWIGFIFLMLLDKVIPHQHINEDSSEGLRCNIGKTTKMGLAVALHNLPEGMAVGVVLASATNAESNISITLAIALAIGIAIQNFPEGAIISLPLRSEGISRKRAFIYGALSGIVEPIAAIITIC